MLSRVADTIYWMARYMERTNGMLQVLRTSYISSQDDIQDFSWRPLLNTYGGDLTPKQIKEAEWDTITVFEYLILGKENITSAYNNILQSRENARAIQDHITKEVWQCLNNYYHLIREPEFEKQLKTSDPVTAIDALIRYGLLFTGIIKNTMTRDESYNYLHIGKFLERAIITSDILRIKMTEIDLDLQPSFDTRGLRYLLYSLFGYETYMKNYKGDFKIEQVLDLIVHNTFFPHSLMFCLHQLNRYHERLKPESFPESYQQLEFLIGKTMNNVKYSNLEATNSKIISSFLLDARRELINIGQSFSKYYFGHT